MIHIYGDSHASRSFKNLKFNHLNYSQSSITMFRIGRDNIIINFNKDFIQNDDILVFSYGEIDCRCHIQKQINLGNNEDDIIFNLVNNYFKTIKNNIIDKNVLIIIVAVIPPTIQYEHEILHGPITHEYPFVGTDEDRVRYTNKINKLLEEMSNYNNYIFFNPYSYYTRPDGTLKFELSDTYGHIEDNSFILEKFTDLFYIK